MEFFSLFAAIWAATVNPISGFVSVSMRLRK